MADLIAGHRYFARRLKQTPAATNWMVAGCCDLNSDGTLKTGNRYPARWVKATGTGGALWMAGCNVPDPASFQLVPGKRYPARLVRGKALAPLWMAAGEGCPSAPLPCVCPDAAMARTLFLSISGPGICDCFTPAVATTYTLTHDATLPYFYRSALFAMFPDRAPPPFCRGFENFSRLAFWVFSCGYPAYGSTNQWALWINDGQPPPDIPFNVCAGPVISRCSPFMATGSISIGSPSIPLCLVDPTDNPCQPADLINYTVSE